MVLSGMTQKALFHRNGILVIKNEAGEYESIEERIDRFDEDIEAKEDEIRTTRNKDIKYALSKQMKEIQKEKRELYKDAKTLVDLSHKTLIFLDSPPERLFSAIMPLLSHDTYESEYEFVDSNKDKGIKTRSVVLRGWPVVIFAQAIDYSHYKRYPEIQRRFIITNPKMDREKYSAAIDLLGDRYGLPDFIYQDKVVSDLEKEQAREIIKGLREKITDVSSSIKPGCNSILIPFKDALMGSLSRERTSDMTFADRILGYITLLSNINIENRPIIKLRKEGSPTTQTVLLATFQDLKEALFLVRYANGVRPYVLDWYYDVFLETFNKETEPKSKIDSKGHEITEIRKAVTTQQLSEATYEIINKKLSPRRIKETYIDQLINEGYIDEEKSELNKSHYIYYPIIETRVSKGAFFDQSTLKTQETKIIVENPSVFPTKEYITSEIEAILRASIQKGFLQINNLDSAQIAEQFYKDPEKYFELRDVHNEGNNDASDNTGDNVEGMYEDGNNIESSGNSDIISNEKNECNSPKIDASKSGENIEKSDVDKANSTKIAGLDANNTNSSVGSPKMGVFDTLSKTFPNNPVEETANTIVVPVEKFLSGKDNEPWQPLPIHSLQQSPCYPIIGTRRYNGGICYYCKLHPNIEFVSLESIEHHCKYHDPEVHKSKILGAGND